MEKVETDVLIIGGGLAGCWAAIGAREMGKRVVLVDKAMVGRSGASTFAAGVMLAPVADDNLDEWARELVENGEFMNDQDWVKVLLQEQIDRMAQMEAFGFPFEREADGTLARIVGRGHKKTRILMFHGHKLMDGMRKQVLAKGVELKERIMATDLLLAPDGRAAGALGFHTRSGKWLLFQADTVILASGQASARDGGGYVDNLSGDGLAMAYRAGVVLTDLEFATQCNISIWRRSYKSAGINMMQGHGARLVNARGERFMEKYDPVLLERSKTYTLSAAFCKEALEGRGPVYMDLRHLKPEVFEKFERVIPKTMQVFKAARIDPRRELIECTPSVHTPQTSCGDGGIRVDLWCRTNIPGLFASGAVSKVGPHGTYAVGGLNLAYCCVSGYRAGKEAARFAKESTRATLPRPEAINDLIEAYKLPAYGPISADTVIDEIKRVTIPAKYSFFKHARRISETLNRLKEIEKEMLPRLLAPDPHHQVKAMETKNYLTCARLVYQACLQRQESRGSLFREEFPNRDDRGWLKWIRVKKVGDEDQFFTEPIPLDRYPIKPEKLAPIPFPVQYFFEK